MRTPILLLALCLAACGPTPKRQPFEVPAQQLLSWPDLRKQPGQIELTTLNTGTVQVPITGMLDFDNPATAELKGGSLQVSVFSHWLRHPIHGDFLIDSGLDARFRDGGQGSYKGLLAAFIVEDSRQRPGQDIGSQMAQLGISPRALFLTHVHGDHTAGIPALPRDIPIVIADGASLHHYPLIMYNDHFDDVETLFELPMAAGVPLAPFEHVIDVFGDQSLLAIAAPGHTESNLSFLVNSSRGWVLLTGDASHTRWGFENRVAPGWSEDGLQAQNSLRRLKEFADANPDVRVIFGHEQ